MTYILKLRNVQKSYANVMNELIDTNFTNQKYFVLHVYYILYYIIYYIIIILYIILYYIV